MADGSVSIWISSCSGQPRTKGSLPSQSHAEKRQPTARTASASDMARRTAPPPMMPPCPKNLGSDVEIVPRPIWVAVAAAPSWSTRARSAAWRPTPRRRRPRSRAAARRPAGSRRHARSRLARGRSPPGRSARAAVEELHRVVRVGVEHLGRDLQVHRAGPARERLAHRAVDQLGQARGIARDGPPLRAAAEEGLVVDRHDRARERVGEVRWRARRDDERGEVVVARRIRGRRRGCGSRDRSRRSRRRAARSPGTSQRPSTRRRPRGAFRCSGCPGTRRAAA